MNIRQLAASTAFILTLTTSAAFATPYEKAPEKEEKQMCPKHGHRRHGAFEKDPLKALEQKREEVLRLLKDGKLTKEKADEIISRIDSKMAEIKEFQKLPLEQRKEKLIKDCETRLNQMIKDGKIQQKDAETKFKEYVDKINRWDGTGYPIFHVRDMKKN